METRTNPPAVKGVTAAILVTAFLYAFVNSISSVLLNEVVAAFSLTGAAQGLLSSMLSVGYMLALLVNPLFQGRTEKLFMLLLSGLLQVAMLLLSGSASSFAVFLTAIVLLGVGCGWLDGYINSCMIDFHPHDSPKYLSLLHGLFGVGSLLAPLLMQALLLGISWRGVFFVIAAMTAGAMLCVALARRGAKGLDSRQQAREERLSLQQFGGYLRKKRNLLLLACGAMCAMVQTGLTCWIVRYMLLVHNNDALGGHLPDRLLGGRHGQPLPGAPPAGAPPAAHSGRRGSVRRPAGPGHPQRKRRRHVPVLRAAGPGHRPLYAHDGGGVRPGLSGQHHPHHLHVHVRDRHRPGGGAHSHGRPVRRRLHPGGHVRAHLRRSAGHPLCRRSPAPAGP